MKPYQNLKTKNKKPGVVCHGMPFLRTGSYSEDLWTAVLWRNDTREVQAESPEYLQLCLHQAASCKAESVWVEENNGLHFKKNQHSRSLGNSFNYGQARGPSTVLLCCLSCHNLRQAAAKLFYCKKIPAKIHLHFLGKDLKHRRLSKHKETFFYYKVANHRNLLPS